MRRRVVVVGVSVLSLIACCALAWWQWERFTEANGSFQNLGYVLQWPLFGLAPAYMFWRWHKLRAQPPTVAVVQPPRPAPPPIPAVHEDHEDDDELAAYNRYLARLNAEESR